VTFVVSLLLALTLIVSPSLAAIPDEPLWSSWLSAGILLGVALTAVATGRGNAGFARQICPAEKSFLVLVGLASLSIPARLMVQHGTGYLGPMLRGWALLATNFALFALTRRVASDKNSLYGLVLAAVAGSAIAADVGVQEYVAHLRAGEGSWRVFGTSTPDFFAGYFVLLLPLTLAIILQAVSLRSLTRLLRGLIALVFGSVLLFQFVSMLTTGSRFALISLGVGIVVFGISLVTAGRHGLILGKATRGLMGVLLVGLLLAGTVFARPVAARFKNLHDNSAAFRVWTWKGAAKMAEANPWLGTGIGTWPDLYPRYALTGFTRLAHNSYLQIADECGIPALLALLATLSLLGVSVKRRLTEAADASLKQQFLPDDPRLLLCGLAGALVGGAAQNLIDSDWSVYFLGATFWTLAGLAAGIAAPETKSREIQKTRAPQLTVVGCVAAIFCAFLAAEGVAAGYGAEDYGAARAWDPLNGHYPSDQGYKVFYLQNNALPEAETALHTAVALEPNTLNYKRLGTVLERAGKAQQAQDAYRSGLAADPNNLDLLLSLGNYRRVSELEMTPVGKVRALGEVTETRFAIADAKMGDLTAMAAPAQAIDYYSRAAKLLEAYVTEGGSANIERQALSGGSVDPRKDLEMRQLYGHVMDALIALAPNDSVLLKRRKQYLRRFEAMRQ